MFDEIAYQRLKEDYQVVKEERDNLHQILDKQLVAIRKFEQAIRQFKHDVEVIKGRSRRGRVKKTGDVRTQKRRTRKGGKK